MKLKKPVKILSLLFLMILCMGIAMSIGRVGGESETAGANPAAAATLEKDTGKAAETTGEHPAPGIENKDLSDFPMSDSFSFVKSLMALAFVLGLIFLAAYLFKKFMGINNAGLRSNRIPIHMVGNLPMGDKKFLSIVEIQGKHFFLGISQGSINLLSELELEMPQEAGMQGSEANRFENIFRKARSLLKNQQPIMRMKNE